MRVKVIPLDFMGQGALLEPADRELHDMAVDYCAHNLANEVNLSKFNKVWVAVAMQGQKYVEIIGITGWVWRHDVPMFRVTGKHAVKATKLLEHRLHSFFEDNGARGADVLLHISSKETPEQRCPKWKESLKASGAAPADRFMIKVGR